MLYGTVCTMCRDSSDAGCKEARSRETESANWWRSYGSSKVVVKVVWQQKPESGLEAKTQNSGDA